MKNVITFDFETRSSKDIKTAGLYNYVNDYLFAILLVSIKINDSPTKVYRFPTPEQLVSLLEIDNPTTVWVAHNAEFERQCLLRYGIEIDVTRFHDTMLSCKYFGLPHSLNGAGSFLNLEQQKLTSGKSLITFFCTPNKSERIIFNKPSDYPEKWKQFEEYCVIDTDVTYNIYKILPQVPDHVFKEYLLDKEINSRGVSVDLTLVEQACSDILADTLYKLTQIKRITGMENPNSPIQMLRWLKSQGLQVDNTKAETIATLEDTLDPNTDLWKVIHMYSTISKTSVAKYPTILKSVSNEGKIYQLIFFYGALTGRWSSKGIQLHNLKRIDKEAMPEYKEIRELARGGSLPHLEGYDVIDTYSTLIRTTLVAEKGNKFIVADFSQIEARILQWLVGNEEALDIFRSGKDFYTFQASRMFNKPYDQIDKKSQERRDGKTGTLLLGYGGGVNALAKAMRGSTEDERKTLVNMWRKANKGVTQLWQTLEKLFTSTLTTGKPTSYKIPYGDYSLDFSKTTINGENYVRLKLPSGREIHYPKAQLKFSGLEYYSGKIPKSLWGGTIVENVAQAIARDCLQIFINRIESRLGKLVKFHVHDEVILEVPLDFDVDLVKPLATKTMYEGLPLSTDPESSLYYDK